MFQCIKSITIPKYIAPDNRVITLAKVSTITKLKFNREQRVLFMSNLVLAKYICSWFNLLLIRIRTIDNSQLKKLLRPRDCQFLFLN